MAKINITAEPGKQVIIIRHIFDAPRELVWKAMTDPDLIPRWWGPKMLATIVDQLDLRRGGIWRFIQRGPEGDDYVFHGVYHDIVPPERVCRPLNLKVCRVMCRFKRRSLMSTTAGQRRLRHLYSSQLRIVTGCSIPVWKRELPNPTIVSPNY